MANARIDFFMPPFEFRLVWPHIAQKRTKDFDGVPLALDDQYYDCSFFFLKTAASPWECRNYMFLAGKLEEIIRAQSGWNGQWPGQISQAGPLRWPISDCDLAQIVPMQPGRPMPTPNLPDKKGTPYLEQNPWARGHWRISAKSDFPPRVVDAGNNDITKNLNGDFVGFKGGDFVFVSLNAYAYVKGTGGIGFGFEGVKKTRDGDPIGGGGGQRSAQDMFGGTPSGTPTGYGAPQVATPPLPAGYGTPAANPTYGAPTAPPPQPQYAPPPSGPTTYPSDPAFAHGAPPTAPYPAPAGQPVAPPAYGAAPPPGYGAPPPLGTR